MHAQAHIIAWFEEFAFTISLLGRGDLKALVVFKEEPDKNPRFASVPAAPELGWNVTLGPKIRRNSFVM